MTRPPSPSLHILVPHTDHLHTAWRSRPALWVQEKMMSHVERSWASTSLSLTPSLSTFHPEMELSQLSLQLTLQQTHALGGLDRDRSGSRTSPLSSALPYPVRLLMDTHPSPQCTRDAPEWPQPGCPGPRGSLGTQCCRHEPCCRHHPGDAAGHSMLHTAHRSGQVSRVAVGEFRCTTGVSHSGPSLPPSLCDSQSTPNSIHTHACCTCTLLA